MGFGVSKTKPVGKINANENLSMTRSHARKAATRTILPGRVAAMSFDPDVASGCSRGRWRVKREEAEAEQREKGGCCGRSQVRGGTGPQLQADSESSYTMEDCSAEWEKARTTEDFPVRPTRHHRDRSTPVLASPHRLPQFSSRAFIRQDRFSIRSSTERDPPTRSPRKSIGIRHSSLDFRLPPRPLLPCLVRRASLVSSS